MKVKNKNDFDWKKNDISLEEVNLAHVDNKRNNLIMVVRIPSKTLVKDWDYYYDFIGDYSFYADFKGEVVPIGEKQPVKRVKEMIPLRYYCNQLDDSLLEPFKTDLSNREKCMLFYQNLLAERKKNENMGKCKIYKKEW